MQENNKEIFSINERIIQIVDYIDITRYKFAQETGISEAVLLNIYKGKNKPSLDFIEKLLNKYKVINPEWLILGNGSMLRGKSDVEINPQSILEPKNEYKKTCELCVEKEKRLQALEMVIEMQKDKIAELQKKKAIVHA